MNRLGWLFAIALSLTGGRAIAAEVLRTENASLNVDGRLQLLGFGQYLDDAHRSDARLYLFLKQARLGLWGNYDDYRFVMTLAFGGEEEVKAPSPGVSLSLLDLYADIPLGSSFLRVGQFRVPYSRERLLDTGVRRFADRSIQNLAFRMGRDIGATFHTKRGSLTGALGVFAGGGRGVPERYLPQRLGTPLFVLRAGFDNGVYDDVFVGRYKEARPERTRTAVFANALYVKDSLVGHSSVLNVRLGEKSLLTNSNWNPYIGQAPMDRGELWQVGGDASFRAPMGPGAFSAELEMNYGRYSNSYGRISVAGGRAQVGYDWNSYEVSLRYAVVFPDEQFAFAAVPITGGRPFHEVTPAVAYSFGDGRMKLILDAPVLLAAPVVTEPGIGGYVLSEQPDQTTVLKTGGSVVDRQNVIEARLLLHASF